VEKKKGERKKEENVYRKINGRPIQTAQLCVGRQVAAANKWAEFAASLQVVHIEPAQLKWGESVAERA